MNTKTTYRKIDIARSQIERAISLFRDFDDYLSAITLAGAAEDVIGKIVSKHGFQPSYALMKEALDRAHSITRKELYTDREYNELVNGPRNHLKHFCDAEDIEINARQEACNLIFRAIQNYDLLVMFVLKEPRSSMMIDWTNSEDVSPVFKMRDA